MSFERVGLKIGLEIHQQLDSHKLFCNCRSELFEGKGYEFVRRLRPTRSEMGEVDKAAVAEFKRRLQFRYQALDATCLVEADEEPPHNANEDAIDIALQIALLLNAEVVDEIQFMRKIIIDGSNTAGFQRTGLVALNGFLDVDGERIRIDTLCLEEDAARKVDDGEEKVYRLDRLGIPEIEIATAPEIDSPEKAKVVAQKIGALLRATRRVKRGIGTIRQDVNVSIKDGARTEIKLVQDLRSIPKIIENEIERQFRLIEIKEELDRRDVKELKKVLKDVSSVFKETDSKVIRKALDKNGKVLALRLECFSGLIGSNSKAGLGNEFAGYARLSGVRGILHSDELPAYGISESELKAVSNALELRENDAFVLVAESEEKARKALEAVFERAKIALKGVPSEVRRVLENCTTEFMRPMSDEARMYPETDVPPVRVTKERVEKIKRSLPELPDAKVERFVREYGITREQARQLVGEGYDDTFESLARRYEFKSLIARTLLNTLPELRSKGIETELISILNDMFSALDEGRFAKEGIPELLSYIAREKVGVKEAIKKLGIERIDVTDIEKIIDKILSDKEKFLRKKGQSAVPSLMGIVMKELRGKADGKIVNQILKRKVEELLR